jgi:hypothetical protein
MLSDDASTVSAAGYTHHCRTSFSETETNRKTVNQQTAVPTDPQSSQFPTTFFANSTILLYRVFHDLWTLLQEVIS